VTESLGIVVGCSSAFHRVEWGARAVGIEADEAFQWPVVVHFNPAGFSWKRRGWGARAGY
jgi:hypothetical protein